MNYVVLASGSRGNATLISHNKRYIMIDCGISKRELTRKLAALNLAITDIEAILVTHEHVDHTRGLKNFPADILYSLPGTIRDEKCHLLRCYEEETIAGFKVTPVPTSHDAYNPCGYVVKDDEETLVYMTDTGYVKEENFKYLTNAAHYIFESNYDSVMLANSGRPWYLQQRIRGMRGHLSNETSARVLAELVGPKTKSVRLSHISADCNTKEIALKEFYEVMKEKGIPCDRIDVRVADRDDMTEGASDDEDC